MKRNDQLGGSKEMGELGEMCGNAVIMFLIGGVIWYIFSRFMKKYPHGYLNRNKEDPTDKINK